MNTYTTSSRRNMHIQQWIRWLKHPSQQKRDGVIVMEGEHGIIAGLAQGFSCKMLIVDEAIEFNALSAAHGFSICDSAIDKCIQCPTSLISSISSLVNVNSRGMLAIFDYPKTVDQPSVDDDILILDRLQDPGNVGTLLRTAAAMDINWVVFMQGTVAIWHPKVVRAAQGAHFQLKFLEAIRHDELAIFHQTILHQRQLLLATADGFPADSYSLLSPQIWVLGNEGEGIHSDFLAVAHKKMAVPMSSRMESLNVAVAGSVLIYEQNRQRRNKHFSACLKNSYLSVSVPSECQ